MRADVVKLFMEMVVIVLYHLNYNWKKRNWFSLSNYHYFRKGNKTIFYFYLFITIGTSMKINYKMNLPL